MTMKYTELYTVLGCDLTQPISQAEIKKAFRRMAAAYHPDKEGGSEEEMAKINHAYAILKDPKSRAKYDATGIGDSIPKDDPLVGMSTLAEILEAVLRPQAKADSGLADMLMGMMGKSEPGYRDFTHVDLLKEVKGLIKQSQDYTKKQQVEHQGKADSLGKILERLKYKFDKKKAKDTIGHKQAERFDPIGGIIKNKQAEHQKAADTAIERQEELITILDMLEHYDFSFEPIPQPPVPESNMRGRKSGPMFMDDYGDHPRSPYGKWKGRY